MKRIAIVGRPNVGKSTLFNRLSKKRIAIVDEAEGVTRDRLYETIECFGEEVKLIDTGGIDPSSDLPYAASVREQAQIAVAEANCLIMVVDGRVGITDLDREVLKILRRSNTPLIVAVNKVDTDDHEYLMHEFYALGVDEMFPISAQHGGGVADMLERALAITPDGGEEMQEERIRVAIIGRPNAGKSTLVNKLLDEERCVTSTERGTTRDSIDIPFGDKYLLIDTAGIRKKKSESEVVEKFAAIRTQRAIERADVCILVLDSLQGMSSHDKTIAAAIEEAGKGLILYFNKWDLSENNRMEHAAQGVRMDSPYFEFCPIIFGSAKTGRNLDQLFFEVEEVHKQLHTRVGTGELNRFVEKAVQLNHPPMLQGKRLRIYYMTQVKSAPPAFTLFVNDPDRLTDGYKRYLINQFRKTYQFTGSPLRMYLRKSKSRTLKP